jgi:hypothetical protein
MGMGTDNSVSQPSGKGQPTMGAPNQYMQGQTGNGDPNNSNGTVSTPSPTVSAPSNDYRSTVGMPQWDSSQISAGPGKGGSSGKGGSTGSGKGSSAISQPTPVTPDPSSGKGGSIGAPDVVPPVAPYVPPVAPMAPTAAPAAPADPTGGMSAQDRLAYSANKVGR